MVPAEAHLLPGPSFPGLTKKHCQGGRVVLSDVTQQVEQLDAAVMLTVGTLGAPPARAASPPPPTCRQQAGTALSSTNLAAARLRTMR